MYVQLLTSYPLFRNSYSKPIHQAFIFGSVDLNSTLHQIEWYNSCMGEAAAQQTSEPTQGIVFTVSKLAAVFLRG